MESEQEDDYFNQCLKSYLDEVRETKLNVLEYCPKLEDLIDIDIDGQEAGGWSFYDSEWKLQDGKTAAEVVRILLANSDYLQDITKTLAIIKINDEGHFSSQDGKAFNSAVMLTLPPIRLIRALLNSSFLSIFECLFLIGYDNENGTINNSVHIANNAISKGIISPRDPDTNLKRNESPTIRLNGDRVIPDLSWLLTFEEAEAWAVDSFGTSLKALRDSLAIAPPPDKPPTQTVNSTEHPTDTQTTDDEKLTDTERLKLLRVIGLLSETLANTKKQHLRKPDGSISIGNGEMGKTGKTNLTKELLDTLQSLSNSQVKGLSKTILQDTIKAGVNALHDSL